MPAYASAGSENDINTATKKEARTVKDRAEVVCLYVARSETMSLESGSGSVCFIQK